MEWNVIFWESETCNWILHFLQVLFRYTEVMSVFIGVILGVKEKKIT